MVSAGYELPYRFAGHRQGTAASRFSAVASRSDFNETTIAYFLLRPLAGECPI